MRWRNRILAAGTLAVLAAAAMLGMRDSGAQEIRPAQYEQVLAMLDECPGLRACMREMVQDERIDRREFRTIRQMHRELREAGIRRRLRLLTAADVAPADAAAEDTAVALKAEF